MIDRFLKRARPTPPVPPSEETKVFYRKLWGQIVNGEIPLSEGGIERIRERTPDPSPEEIKRIINQANHRL